MNTQILTIHSNRELQREFEGQIRIAYPEIEPLFYVRKAADTLQITEIVIRSADLAVALVALAYQIHDKQSKNEKSELLIELQDGARKIKIHSRGDHIDIERVIEAFYHPDQEPQLLDSSGKQ